MVNRYIFDLYYSRISDIDLGESKIYVLCQFVKSREMSTYQICNHLKTTRYKEAYKNIHEKIQMFQKCGLIKATKTIDRKHGSKYYTLTPIGIFCIFYNLYGKSLLFYENEMNNIIMWMLNYYGDDEFLNLFVYPFFEKSTLLKLKSNTILGFFLNYCTEMAHKVTSILFDVTVVDKEIVPEAGFKKRNTHESKQYLRKKEQIEGFLINLKNNLDEEERMNSEIKFNQPPDMDGKERYLRYSEATNNFFNEYLTSELNIQRSNIIEKNIVLPIISEGKYWSESLEKYKESKFKPSDVKHWENVEKDIAVLINGKKFYEILKITKDNFNNCYHNILSLRQ